MAKSKFGGKEERDSLKKKGRSDYMGGTGDGQFNIAIHKINDSSGSDIDSPRLKARLPLSKSVEISTQATN